MLIAGESAAASAVDVDLEHHVGAVVLWNRDCCCCCCCKILLLGVPLIVKLVDDVEIVVRSTAGLMLKADVVVMGRLP